MGYGMDLSLLLTLQILFFLFFEGISTGIKIKHIYVTLVYTVQSLFFIENVPKSEINIYCLQMKSTE